MTITKRIRTKVIFTTIFICFRAMGLYAIISAQTLSWWGITSIAGSLFMAAGLGLILKRV